MVGDRTDVPDSPLTWDHSMSLLTDRYVMWDLTRVVVASVVALEFLVFGMGFLVNGEAVLLPIEVLALVLAIIGVLAVFAAGVVLGNRYSVRFTLDGRGVLMESGARERRWNRIALWVGLLAGKPQLVGAALMSQSREAEAVEWRDVVRVVPYPARRVIELRNSWRTVMRLYCSPGLYETVAVRVEREVEAAAGHRRARSAELPPLPPRRWGLATVWLSATAVAFVVSNAWPWLPGEAARVALAAAIVVAVSGILAGTGGRLCGLLGFALTSAVVVLLAIEAFDTFPTIGGGTAATWELETNLLLASIAGLVTLGLLGLAASRGHGAGLFLRERSTRRGGRRVGSSAAGTMAGRESGRSRSGPGSAT